MSDINVDDWGKFLERNDNALILLNECTSCIADSMTYTTNISSMIKEINGLFDGLVMFKMPTRGTTVCAPDVSDLVTENDALASWFNQHNVNVIVSLDAIEDMIENYNNEYNTPEKRKAFLLRALKATSDYGLYWALYSGLKNTKFGALTFLAVYGTDAAYDSGNFIVGDGAGKAFKALAGSLKAGEMVKPSTVSWSATGFGMIIVMAYTAAGKAMHDEGDWTSNDTKRLLVDSTISGLEYAGWTALAGYGGAAASAVLTAAGVGSAAGPVGAAIGAVGASVVVYVFHPTLKAIGDYWVGDNIIDVYVDSNGNEFSIPRNGNGEKGTYDVILERTTKMYGRTGVTATDKISLYRSCENGYQPTGKDFYPVDEYTAAVGPAYDTSGFNKFLTDIKNASDPSEIPAIISRNGCVELNDQIIPITSLNEDFSVSDNVYSDAQSQGFDVREYYAYTHGDYGYIADKYPKDITYEFGDTSSTEK